MSQIPIYTIGYGAREIEAFIAVLKQFGIEYLIDVRTAPYSRYKPEFSKKSLERILQAHNIRYVYMGDTLGGQPDDPDCYSDGKVDYQAVAGKAFYHQGIDRLHEAYRQQAPVVLMCSEGKPETCHRSALIGKTLAAEGIEVGHIDENDRLISQQEAILRRNKGQLGLFGDDFQSFTSRKRYRDES